MKRVYVNEEWCLGCHLCEYNCAFANSGKKDMAAALKDKKIFPRIHVEGDDKITFAVSCRHCEDPICVKSCIAGAISKQDGVVKIDRNKCVGLYWIVKTVSTRILEFVIYLIVISVIMILILMEEMKAHSYG